MSCFECFGFQLKRRVKPPTTASHNVNARNPSILTPSNDITSQLLSYSQTLPSLACMPMELARKCDHQIYSASHLMLTLNLSSFQQNLRLGRFRLSSYGLLFRCCHEKPSLSPNESLLHTCWSAGISRGEPIKDCLCLSKVLKIIFVVFLQV